MYTLTSKLKQNFRNENQAGLTLPFAKISGIISDYTLFSYWPIFPLSPETVPGVEPQETPKFLFKIPYVQYFPVTAQRSIRKLANRLCKPIDLRLDFTTFKVRNLFNVKDAVSEGLRTRVVYKFSCASCNACYVSETSRHFSTRVREHLLSDRSSNVFKHLQSSELCRASCTPDYFEILDSAATKHQVKLKESMFIKWEKPDINQQVKHINPTLSL